MLIALAITDNKIAQHFGHCEYFNVYNVEDNQIINENKIINPPHQKGLLPKFLKERNIDVLITGNLGSLAVKNLEELGIKAIRGVSGEKEEIIKAFLNESLDSSDEICEEHAYRNH